MKKERKTKSKKEERKEKKGNNKERKILEKEVSNSLVSAIFGPSFISWVQDRWIHMALYAKTNKARKGYSGSSSSSPAAGLTCPACDPDVIRSNRDPRSFEVDPLEAAPATADVVVVAVVPVDPRREIDAVAADGCEGDARAALDDRRIGLDGAEDEEEGELEEELVTGPARASAAALRFLTSWSSCRNWMSRSFTTPARTQRRQRT